MVVTGEMSVKKITGTAPEGGAVSICGRIVVIGWRAIDRGGTPLGNPMETPTEKFVPAGASLLGRVMFSVKLPTFGRGMGIPTLEAGTDVDADCGAELGCNTGE